MLLDGKKLVITGVLTKDSIATAVARFAQEQGAEVVLTSFGRGMRLTQRVARSLPTPPDVLELDVTEPAQYDALVAELREHVAKRIGKLARPRRIIWADDLPKTRSGKIMRRLLRDVTDGRELGDVSTLADPSVVVSLQQRVAGT